MIIKLNTERIFLRFFFFLSVWNEQSQVYQLDFGGRVTLESAKNFQIEFNNKQVRSISEEIFSFDCVLGYSIRSDRKQLLYSRFRMAIFTITSLRSCSCKYHTTS